MHWIRNVIPYRYFVWLFSGIAFIASLGMLWWNPLIGATPSLLFGALTLLGSIDFFQKKQAIRRNYPIMAHFRFLFESIRPEIRQYFLESDTEAIPFSRAQRSLVYQRAKGAVDKKAYGTLIVRRLSINEVALVSALIAYLKPGDLLDNRAAHPVYQMFWDMASPDTFAAVAPAEQVVAVA